MSSLEDLEVFAEDLLKRAHDLPQSDDRDTALKDIAKLRQKLEALKIQRARAPQALSNSSPQL